MPHHTCEDFAAVVGLDWADAHHDVCRPAAGTTHREFLVLAHRPEAIDAWGQTLRTRCHGHPIAVGLARNTGPLVSALRTDDCLVRFPVQPLPLAQSRAAFPPSRATEEPPAADLQVALLLTHRNKLPPLSPPSPPRRALAQLGEHRRRLAGDKVRRTNRLRRTLTNAFPHVLQWRQDKDTAIFGDFLSHWPTLKAAQLARRTPLERCFRPPTSAPPPSSRPVLRPSRALWP